MDILSFFFFCWIGATANFLLGFLCKMWICGSIKCISTLEREITPYSPQRRRYDHNKIVMLSITKGTLFLMNFYYSCFMFHINFSVPFGVEMIKGVCFPSLTCKISCIISQVWLFVEWLHICMLRGWSIQWWSCKLHMSFNSTQSFKVWHCKRMTTVLVSCF